MNDFEKGFMAGFIGYMIGAWIDNTRFGIWFNTNPVITFIWNAGKALLKIVCAFLILYFVYCVMSTF